jgi:hypothetical protein
MDHLSRQGDSRTDETRTVFSSIDNWSAEAIQFLLLALDIRAVVRQRDPFALGTMAFEVLVMSVDHIKAQQALEESQIVSRGEEWQCPECREPVPGNFDVCWNCETVHPELAAQDEGAIEMEEPASHVNVG